MTGYATHPRSSKVYGAQANYIRKPRSDFDTLPSRYTSTSSRLELSNIGSGSRNLIGDRPNDSTYSYNSYLSNSNDLVRPATRHRGSSLRVSSGYNSDTDYKYSSSESRRRTKRISYTSNFNLSSSSREKHLPNTMVATDTSSCSTPLKSDHSQSLRLEKKDLVTMDGQPYKEPYVPSFSGSPKRSTPSPSRSLGKESGGNVGLRNIGNTCFMNSILQCLSNTTILREYCMDETYKGEINRNSPMKGDLMRAFVEVLVRLWKPNGISHSPNNFKSKIQKFSPRFMGYEQQDCQEFLRFLLEGLHEDINRVRIKSKEPLRELSHLSPQEKARATWSWYTTKDDSFIFDLFVGQLESSLECQECRHTSLTYDPFWDLSLPISKKMYSNEVTTITDCLDNFTREETLDKDEKPICERCKVRRTMTKKLSIHKFPKVLVLHLKRFNEGSRYRQKLNNLVKFPVTSLNLRNFASKTREGNLPPTYDLYAVSNHCGSCYGGHYTAYCYNSSSHAWLEYNDSSVNPISDGDVCTKEAYVLFYVRKEGSSRL
nr:ubiquitin carboxyl-terminal hydrolase 2 isoform X1 [Ciona intestinalis]|eukprot:XP_009858247.1 ubiquitin carboxyl-terminal hydrolase 2 isoform X1 [Ciona intestinalis]